MKRKGIRGPVGNHDAEVGTSTQQYGTQHVTEGGRDAVNEKDSNTDKEDEGQEVQDEQEQKIKCKKIRTTQLK
jgi:hypothetical protein